MSVSTLVAVLAAVTAGAAGSAISYADKGAIQCAAYCKQETDKISKFKYSPGTTYEYAYQSEIITSMAGSDRNESRLHVTAVAEIYPYTLCDYTLKLKNVELKSSRPDNSSEQEPANGADTFRRQLEERPLHFSFQDGVVDELCAAPGEPVWALNVKRGILSIFQNSMPDFKVDATVYETDVTGTCETHYTHNGLKNDELVLQKTKNLMACAHRMDHHLSVQSAPYASPSPANTLPLLRSTHTCEQRLNFDGHLQHSECGETHLFRPFSSGESGARTSVRSVLRLLSVHAEETEPEASRTSDISRRTTLLFEHDLHYDNHDGVSTVESVGALLSAMASRVEDGVDKEAAAMFSRLVSDLRSLQVDQLSSLFDETQLPRERRFLLDALPLVGTPESLEAMVSLWKSEQITGTEMDSWLAASPFQSRAKPQMISALMPLLDGIPRARVLLAVSALIHGVCQANPGTDCVQIPQVATASARLERLLGSNCHALGREQTDLVLLALRSIGNAGVVRSSTAPILAQCMEVTNPVEVRLAAVNAWRRAPCESQPSSTFLRMYNQRLMDVEVRIASYLAAMRCPSPSVLRVVKETLYSEEVNQVASFVWTHLTNLQETSSPWKQHLRELLESDYLKNKFKTDARKFSRNYEGSLFIDKINAGITTESNVVFSPQSYLPRSANLNLTVDIFGESINLFEVGARIEGFESLVEGIFAPNGAFPDEGVKTMLQTMRGQPTSEAENSIAKLSSAFDARSRMPQEPHGEFFARVFGNELQYSRFHGLRELGESTEAFTHPMKSIMNFLQQSEIDVTKSLVFLDAAYTIPTVTGMPLELTVNGSATLGLQVRGRLELADILTKRAALVEGRIAPSAAVHVIANMGVDAFTTRTGLRTVSTLHSNTYMDGKIRVDGGKLVEVSLNVPREKMDVVEVTSKLYIMHRDQPTELSGIMQDREVIKGCTSEMASTITGFKMCGALEYANASLVSEAPYFPLTGPYKYSLSLVRTDSFTSYNFIYKGEMDRTNDLFSPRSWTVSLDTPGSRIDRKLSGMLWLDARHLGTRIVLASPWASFEATGKANLARDRRSLDVTVTKDGRELLALAASCVQSTSSEQGAVTSSKLEPTMSITWRQRPLLDMRGSIGYVSGSKYSADLSIGGLTAQPVSLAVDVTRADARWNLTASARAPGVDIGVQGSTRLTPPSYLSTKLTATYKLRGNARHDIDFAAKYQSNDKGALSKRAAFVNLQMSQFSKYNVIASVDLQRADRFWESNQQLGLGNTIWSSQQLYRNRHPSSEHHDFAFKLGLTCPVKGVDYHLDLQHQTGDRKLSSHAMLQYTKAVRWNAQLEYGAEVRHGHATYNLLTEAACPWRVIGFKADVVERQRGQYHASALGRYEVTVPRGPKQHHELVVNGSYVDSSTAVSVHHSLELDASFPKSSEEWAVPFRITGAVAASNGRSRQWLQLDRTGKQYRIDLDYTKNKYHVLDVLVRLDTKAYKSRLALLNEPMEKGFTVDLQFTKRFVLDTKISCDGDKHVVSVEMFWDKDVDPSKRVALHAEADSESNQAELAFPDQYIKLHVIKLPNGFSSELEWTEGESITLAAEWVLAIQGGKVSARLTTPFSGYELQTLAATYGFQEQQTDAQVDVTWRDQMLSTNLFAVNMDGDFRITTRITSSVAMLRDITLHVSHADIKNGTKRDMKSHASLDFNGEVTAAEALLLATQVGVSGTASFKSPLELVRSLSGKFALENDVYGDRGNLEISWAPNKRAGGQFELVLGTNPHALVQIVTPFEGYELTVAEFLYNMKENGMQLDLRGEFNHKTVSLGLEGKRTEAELSGSAKVKTPFTKDTTLLAVHSTQKGTLKDQLLILSGDRNVLEFDLDGDLKFPTTVNIHGRLLVPNYTLKANIQNTVDKTGFNTVIGGELNKDSASLRMTGSFQKELAFTSVSYRLTVSGTVLPQEITLAFSHQHKPSAYYIGNLSLPGGITIGHSLNFDDPTHWINKITVKTPSKSGSIVNLHNMAGDGSELDHRMTAEINGRKTTASIYYSKYLAGYIKNIEAMLTTPWTDPVKLDFDMPFEGQYTCSPKLKISYKNKTVSAASIIRFNRQTSTHTASLQFSAPFCSPVYVNADMALMSPQKTFGVNVKWDNKVMDIEGNLLVGKLKSEVSIIVIRPDLGNDVFRGTAGFDLITPVKTAAFSVHINEDKWNGDIRVGMSPGKYVAGAAYHLPISNWETFKILGEIDLTKQTKLAVFSYNRNEDRLTISASVVVDRSSPRLSLSLDSQVPGIKTAAFLAAYDRSNEHIVNVKYNQEDLVVELKGKLRTHDLSGIAAVMLTSPIPNHESMSVVFEYDLEGKEQNVKLLATLRNDWSVLFEGNSALGERGQGEAFLKLQLPYDGLEDLKVSLKQDVTAEMRTLRVVLSNNEKAVSILGNLSTPGDSRVIINTVLETPFEDFESITGKLNFTAEKTWVKSVEVSMQRNENVFEAVGSINLQGPEGEGSLNIFTPFEGYEGFSSRFMYDFSKSFKTTQVQYSTSKNVRNYVQAFVDVDNVWKCRVNMTIRAPTFGYPMITVTSNHNLEDSEDKFVELEILSDKSERVFTGKAHMQKNTISAWFTTPKESLNDVFLSGSLTSKDGVKSVMVELKNRNSDYRMLFAANMLQMKSDLTINVTTPFEEWREMQMVGMYDFLLAKKMASILFTRNTQTVFGASAEGAIALSTGNAAIRLSTSFLDFSSLVYKGNYDIKENYSAGISEERDGISKTLSGQLAIESNGANLNMQTPYQGYEDITLTGRYANGNVKSASVFWETNGKNKSFEIYISNQNKLAKIDLKTPISGFETINMSVDYAGLLNNNTKYSLDIGIKAEEKVFLRLAGTLSLDFDRKVTGEAVVDIPSIGGFFDNMAMEFAVTPSIPPRMIRAVIKNSEELSFELKSDIFNEYDGGFTATTTFRDSSERRFRLEFYPRDITMKSSIAVDDAILLSGEFSFDSNKNKINLEFKTPWEKYEHIGLGWRHTNTSVSAWMKTPIEELEDLSAVGEVKIEKLSDSSAKFTARRNKDIFDLDVKVQYNNQHCDSYVSVETPLRGYQNLGVAVKYKTDNPKKSGMIQLRRNENLLKIGGDLTLSGLTADCSLKIVTPFDGYKDVHFEGSYDFEKRGEKKLTLVGDFDEVRRVNTRFRLVYGGMHSSIEIISETPISFATFSVIGEYDYNIPTNTWNIKSSLKLNDVKAEVTSVIVKNKKGQLNVFYTLKGVSKKVKVDWQLENGPNHKKAAFSVDMGPGKKIEASASMYIDGFKNVETDVTITSLNAQTYSLTAQWNMARDNVIAGNIGLQWGKDKEIRLEGDLEIGESKKPVKLDLKLTTPFKHLENVTFTSVVTYENELILTTILQWDEMRRITLSSLFNHSPLHTNCKVEFMTPFTKPLLFIFNQDHVGLLEALFQLGDEKYQLQGNIAQHSPRHFELTITLTTPQEGLRHLKVHGAYNLGVGDKFAVASFTKETDTAGIHVSIKSEQNKQSVKLSVTAFDSQEWSFFGSLNRVKGLAADATVKWSDSDKIDVKLNCVPRNWIFEARTPFPGYKKIDAKYIFETTGSKKQGQIGVSWDLSQYDLTGSVELENIDDVDFEFALTTPFTGNIAATGNYKRGDGHRVRMTVKDKRKSHKVEGKLRYEKKENRFDLHFESSKDDQRGVEIKSGFSLDEHGGLKQATFNMRVGQSLNFAIEGQVSKDFVSLKVSADSPSGVFKELGSGFKVACTASMKSSPGVVRGTLSFTHNGTVYQASGSGNYQPGNIRLKITMNVPGQVSEDIFIITRYDTNSVTFVMGTIDKKFEFEGVYVLTGPLYSVNATLKSPYIKMLEHLALRTNVDAENLKGYILGQWTPVDKIVGQANVHSNEVLVRIETPFKSWETVEVSGQYTRNNLAVYDLESKANWDDFEIKLTGTLNSVPSDFGVWGELQWAESKKIDLNATVQVTGGENLNSIECKFRLNTPFNQLNKMELDFGLDMATKGQLSSRLSLATPFEMLPELRSSLVLRNDDYRQMSGLIEATALGREMLIGANISNDALQNVNLKLQVLIPFLDIPPITVEGNLNQKEWRSVDSEIKVSFPRNIYHVGGNYRLEGMKLDAQFIMETPVITTEVAFGGELAYENPKKFNGRAYFGGNNVSLEYELKKTSLSGKVGLNVPSLDVKSANLEVQAAYSPTIDVFISYDCLKHSGSLRFSLEHKSDSVTSRLDLDIPQLLGLQRRTLQVTFKFPGPSYSMLITLESSSTHRIAIYVDNGKEKLNVNGTILSTMFGERNAYICLQKDWEAFDVNINNVLIVIKEKKSGSITLNYRMKQHRMQYFLDSTKGMGGNVEMESPLIRSKKMIVSGNFVKEANRVFAEIDCILGAANHRGSLTLLLGNDGSTNVAVEVLSIGEILLKFDSSASYNNESTSAHVIVQYKGTFHKVDMRHKRTLPLDSKLKISSPIIGPQEFVASVVSKKESILAYASSEDTSEYSAENNYLHVEAAVKRSEGQAFLNIRAPRVPCLKQLSIRGDFRAQDFTNIHMNFEMNFHSDFADILLHSFLVLNNTVLQAKLELNTPIQDFERLFISIRVPLVLSKDIDAHVKASLPNGYKYGAQATFKNLAERLELGLKAECKGRRLGGAINLSFSPLYTFEAEFNSPFEPFQRYLLSLNFRDGHDFVHFVEWNEKRIELRYSIADEIRAQLTTPFVFCERYALALKIENNRRKALSIKISHPQLRQDLVVEFGFTFNGMSDVSLIAMINADIHPAFQSASLLFGNKLNAQNKSYNGLLFARYNDQELFFSAEGMLKPDLIMTEIQADVNSRQLYFQAKGGIEDELIKLSLQLETPFEVIRDAEILLQASNKQLIGTEARIVHNTHEYLGLSVRRDDLTNVTTFEARNSWRPVSVSYVASIEPELRLLGEVCWDLNEADTSKIMIETSVHVTKDDAVCRRKLTSVIQVPTRVVSLSCVHEIGPSKHEYGVQFSIEEGKVYGMGLVVDNSTNETEVEYRARAELQLPSRTLEMSRYAVISHSGDFHQLKGFGGEFLWDATADREKKISIQLQRSSGAGELRFHHAALNHDFVVRYSQSENRLRTEFEYSPLMEDQVVLEGFYEDTEGHFKTGFSLRHDASDVDLTLTVLGDTAQEKSSGLINIKYLDGRTGQDRVLELRGNIQHTHPAFETTVFTNENKIILSGELWSKGKGIFRGATARVQMNQKDPLTIQARLNAADDTPSINVDLTYGDSRTYSMFAGMPNHREVKASAHHTLFGTQTVDGLFSMRLNTSKLFWTRASWRPGVLDELQAGIIREYTDLVYAGNAIYDGFTDFLREDVGQKWERIHPRVILTLEEVLEYNIEQRKLIAEDIPNVLDLIHDHYEHNDFFVKDLWYFFSTTASAARSGVSCVGEHFTEVLEAFYLAAKSFTSVVFDVLYVDFSITLDVVPSLKALGQNAMQHWNSTVSELAAMRNATHRWTRNLLASTLANLARFEAAVAAQARAWEAFVEEAQRRCEQAIVPALLAAQDIFAYINYHVTQLQESISAFVDSVKRHLLSMEEVRELLHVYSQYASWLEDFHMQEYMDQWLTEICDTAEWIVRDLRQTYADYKQYWDALYDAAFGHYENLNKLPPVAYVRRIANKAYQKALWAWRYYELTKELTDGLLWLLHELEVALLDLVNAIDASSHGRVSMEPTSNLILDTDRGLLEYTQTLPVHWHGFDRLPEFQELSPYRVTQEPTADISALDKYRYYLLDALNEYRSGIKLSRWLPPYSASAMIIGRHHFMTFDKQFFDFAGECPSYLLTSDFVSSKFSALVNYEIQNRKVEKKSLTVMSDGHRIDIGVNRRITVDGKKAETPMLIGESTTLTRDGDRVLVTSQYGMTVDCNLRYDVCSVDITGWHFGKTGGLLGTYDNEPANDLALPTGQIVSRDDQGLEEFADAWRVGRKQCNTKNHAVAAPARPQDRELVREAQELCNAYFLDSDSPLAPCFPRVDPAPFRGLCEADVRQQANSPARDRALCAPAAAYVDQCLRAGMELWIPQFCVRCDLPDGNVLAAGEVKVFSKGSAPPSADVVLIVEQASCLRNIPIEELPLKLDVALKRQGITNNRFAVVAFGGDPSETFRAPHTRSTEGSVWATSRNIEKALNGVSMSAVQPSDTPVRDAYDALWMAARLPFRAGVSKTLVMVGCHECRGDSHEQTDGFSDLASVLTDGDFTMHLLTPGVVRVRKASSKQGRIFGADREGVYTPRNVKNLQPSKPLLKQVTLSKDLCTPLALESNGTVFNLDRMSNTALGNGPSIPVLNKKFLDVWSRRVAAHATPADCQRCDCVADRDGNGRSICQRCLSPTIEQFLQEWEDMTDDEYEEMEVEMDFPEYSDEDTDITKI